MHAAIKTLEDTLLIRRLQARQLGLPSVGLEHSKWNDERLAAIHEDIASLERGLRLLEAARDQKSEVSGQQKSCGCAAPTIINQKSQIANSHEGASCSI